MITGCKHLDNIAMSTRISLAVELLEAVARPSQIIPDPSRFYFLAGFLFDSLSFVERSLHCYEQAFHYANIAFHDQYAIKRIVESYDMQFDTPEYHRKLERASKSRIHHIIKKRESMMQGYVKQETERQRLIVIISSLLLLRIYLDKTNHDKAQSTIHVLLEYSDRSITSIERREVLLSIHEMLKVYTSTKPSEWSPQIQVLRNSPGPLPETHLKILLELKSIGDELACRGMRDL